MRRLFTWFLLCSVHTLAAQAPNPSGPAIDPVMTSTPPHYHRVEDYILLSDDQMPAAYYPLRPPHRSRNPADAQTSPADLDGSASAGSGAPGGSGGAVLRNPGLLGARQVSGALVG